jgi:hypothetical protein
MTCIEFLILRARAEKAADAVAVLADTLKKMEKPTDMLGYRILRHKNIPGDVALLLQWQTEIDTDGSILGQRLKPILTTHGIVNHTVWVVSEENG